VKGINVLEIKIQDYGGLAEMNWAADWSEFGTAVVTAVGLAATVYSIWAASRQASRERKTALDQAEQDQKWRQTVEAQAAVRRLLDDKRALHAMTMLDDKADHAFPDDGIAKPDEITKEDIVSALQAVGPSYTKKQTFVRDSMDSLFNHFELIQQGIEAKIYTLEQIKFPINYYVRMMDLIGKQDFSKYIGESGYEKSNTLIDDILNMPSKASTSKDSVGDA
jgi:hypothetical protein